MIYNNEKIMNYHLKEEILTPLMLKRLLDCLEVNVSESCMVENMKFELVDLGFIYVDKSPIYINDMWYTYDYIGIKNNPINGVIGCNSIRLYGSDGIGTINDLDGYKLYNDYLGKGNMSCCHGEIDKVKFRESQLQFEIKNLEIAIQGTIGNDPFMGVYTYSGSIV